MKLTIKLKDLLQQNSAAIAATGTFINQGLATLDCTGVDEITPEQLTLLLKDIPESWDLKEILEVFDASTLTQTVAAQIGQWIDRRKKRESSQTPTPDYTTETAPTHLDIFKLRQDVVDDYRCYIQSFLKIRDFSRDGKPFRFHYHQEQAFRTAPRSLHPHHGHGFR